MLITDRIKGRVVEIEVGEATGIGWVAVGVVKEGLSHEKGMRFEAKASDPIDAERQLRAEIEAYFAS
jgi:hypothetical protein